MSYPFEVMRPYNFQVWPTAILGTNFNGATVLGIIDMETAMTIADVATRHRQVYPYLPQGVPDDPTAYTYLKLRLVSGAVTVIGTPWIREDTIVEQVAKTAVVKVANCTPSDIPKIKLALTSNGYPNVDITLQ